MRRAEPALVPDDAPLALVQSESHGIRITAVNARAAAEGVRVGQALADARAALPSLMSRPAEPRRDRAALLRLARWCGRYGPNRHADGEDGLWIEVTGVAHLYGGEVRLLENLCGKLAGFGLAARAGLADTLGAAHAFARFGAAGVRPSGSDTVGGAFVSGSDPEGQTPAWIMSPPGKTEAQLAPLPVEALRLASETVLLLKRLGLKRVSQLYSLPRAALQRRFRSAQAAEAVLLRLDQALGLAPEPRRPLEEPPALFVKRPFADPLLSAEGLEAETARLTEELCRSLDARNLGARRICLSLYRADGTVAEARTGLSFPCRAPQHLMALLKEKLPHLDAGFGIDALVLAASHVERREARQAALAARLGAAAADAPALLIDRLTNRLGHGRVVRLEPRASHIPERAEMAKPALHAPAAPRVADTPQRCGASRPAFLLASPEPIDVIAEVPEGPPARFTWRRVERRIARAEGPERIAPEWWREIGQRTDTKMGRTRDYYRIEDEGGAGYWVFREGLYGREEEAPSWFLHGLFG
jgi:protein ImuB